MYGDVYPIMWEEKTQNTNHKSFKHIRTQNIFKPCSEIPLQVSNVDLTKITKTLENGKAPTSQPKKWGRGETYSGMAAAQNQDGTRQCEVDCSVSEDVILVIWSRDSNSKPTACSGRDWTLFEGRGSSTHRDCANKQDRNPSIDAWGDFTLFHTHNPSKVLMAGGLKTQSDESLLKKKKAKETNRAWDHCKRNNYSVKQRKLQTKDKRTNNDSRKDHFCWKGLDFYLQLLPFYIFTVIMIFPLKLSWKPDKRKISLIILVLKLKTEILFLLLCQLLWCFHADFWAWIHHGECLSVASSSGFHLGASHPAVCPAALLPWEPQISSNQPQRGEQSLQRWDTESSRPEKQADSEQIEGSYYSYYFQC